MGRIVNADIDKGNTLRQTSVTIGISMLLCSNCLTAILLTFNAYNSTVMYAFYGMAFLLSFSSIPNILRFKLTPFYMAVFMLVVLSTISCLITSRDLETLAKFYIGILIAINCTKLTEKQVKMVFLISSYICIAYSLFLLGNMGKLKEIMKTTGFNYLSITLPLGWILSASLSKLFYKMEKHEIFVSILTMLLSLITISMFSARGAFLFPLAILALSGLWYARKSFKRSVRTIVLLSLLGVFFVYIINMFIDQTLLLRLIRLISDTSEETRVGLYEGYLRAIVTKGHWVLGIGFSNSRVITNSIGYTAYYPHNFLLEFFGELGIMGLTLALYISFYVGKSAFALMKKSSETFCSLYLSKSVVYAAIGGLLYYFFTYFKSFSIYDGYQLFIHIAIIINFANLKKEKTNF